MVWSDFQECLGCTIALLQSTAPTPAQLILQQISLAYNEAAMAAAGFDAEKSFNDAFAEGAYWVIEGSVPNELEGAFSVGGKSAQQILKENYSKAKGVIAAGNCASFGNVQAAYPNPTGAMGMLAFMQQEGIDTAKLIQLPTCPVNPVHITAAVSYFLTYKKLPAVDEWNRPKAWFGRKIHDECFRRAAFDEGRFVEQLGSPEEAAGYCLYKMGCGARSRTRHRPLEQTGATGASAPASASGAPSPTSGTSSPIFTLPCRVWESPGRGASESTPIRWGSGLPL